jgi:hypothetical protein
MYWAVAIIAVYVAGFLVFWTLCRTAPIMREEDDEQPHFAMDAEERSMEDRGSAEHQGAGGADAARRSEPLAADSTAALNAPGNPTPQPVRHPVHMRAHDNRSHQHQEEIGCQVQQ